MPEERRIKVGADVSGAVSEYQKLENQARRLADSLMADAEREKESYNERVKSIEQVLRLQEQREAFELRQMRRQARYAPPEQQAVAQEQYRAREAQVDAASEIRRLAGQQARTQLRERVREEEEETEERAAGRMPGMGAIAGVAAGALGAAGIGTGLGWIFQQMLGRGIQEQIAREPLGGLFRGTALDDPREAGVANISGFRQTAASLRMGGAEFARLGETIARVSLRTSDLNQNLENTERAVQFQRLFGLTPEQIQGAARITRYGGPELENVLVNALGRAGDVRGAEFGQMLANVASLSGQVAQYVGNLNESGAYRAIQTFMGMRQGGGVFGGGGGFFGDERGVGMIARMNQAMVQGGGEAALAFYQRAIAEGMRRRGEEADLYTIEKARQQGIFGRGGMNLVDVMSLLQRELAGGQPLTGPGGQLTQAGKAVAFGLGAPGLGSLTPEMAEEFIKAIEEVGLTEIERRLEERGGGAKLEDVLDEDARKRLQQLASQASAHHDKALEKLKTMLQEIGQPFLNAMTSIAEGITSILSGLQSIEFMNIGSFFKTPGAKEREATERRKSWGRRRLTEEGFEPGDILQWAAEELPSVTPERRHIQYLVDRIKQIEREEGLAGGISGLTELEERITRGRGKVTYHELKEGIRKIAPELFIPEEKLPEEMQRLKQILTGTEEEKGGLTAGDISNLRNKQTMFMEMLRKEWIRGGYGEKTGEEWATESGNMMRQLREIFDRLERSGKLPKELSMGEGGPIDLALLGSVLNNLNNTLSKVDDNQKANTESTRLNTEKITMREDPVTTQDYIG